MDIEKIISEMSLEEKISFCTGQDMWHTKAMEKYGIEPVMMTDGPHGLRCQQNTGDNLGLNDSLPATCFPTAVTAGNTWDPGLLYEEGKAIAEEALEYGVSTVLGPGVNIKRNPLGGRNFEYFSEDPHLAGKLAAGWIKGVQSEGVGTSLKHFACNSQEYKRQNGNSIVDDRAMHEIYLKPFEIAVKEAHPSTVMCSYNQINGIYASDHRYLLTDVLRNAWGFEGMVVTDWGAMHDRIEGFKAGCDLNMPGGSGFMEKAVLEAVRNGTLDEKDINTSVRRILRFVEKGLANGKEYTFDRKRHHELAKHIADEGAVLLKNDGILPLKKEETCIIGRMAEEIRYQGSGSSHINPTVLEQIRDIWSDVPYAEGVDRYGNLSSISAALQIAKTKKNAVLFLGLPESFESESYDRDHMRLPEGHSRLVEEITRVNPNVVVVLFGGSAMEIPWADRVKAILYMGLPGQAGARSVTDILEGKVNPSGKLGETWPLSYDDVISKDTFKKKYTQYRESIFVGYRYYDKTGMNVRYPFGHGLSFTSFAYSDMEIKDGIISLNVTNTGEITGKEIVQLYVFPCDQTFRPLRELKAFTKIELQPHETKNVTFAIDDSFFEVYRNGFVKAAGKYLLEAGSSSGDIRISLPYEAEGRQISFEEYGGTWYADLQGSPEQEDFEKVYRRKIPAFEEAKKGSFTMDSTCMEMKDESLVMKGMYKIIKTVISMQFRKEERTMNNPSYRMMLTAAADCPMRAVVISAGGALNEHIAEGLVKIANAKLLPSLPAWRKRKKSHSY